MDSFLHTLFIFSLPVLLALTLHEVAHARAAFYFGDRTASQAGRFSLNPLRHIDPFGTILLPLMLYFSSNGQIVFGFLKPVPVNPNNLRNPKKHMGLVALAGPAANFVQAFFWLLLASQLRHAPPDDALVQIAQAGVLVNLIICAVNLLPLPPFDGGRILISILPDAAARSVARLEAYGMYIMVGLLLLQAVNVFSLIDNWTLPLMNLLHRLLQILLFPFISL